MSLSSFAPLGTSTTKAVVPIATVSVPPPPPPLSPPLPHAPSTNAITRKFFIACGSNTRPERRSGRRHDIIDAIVDGDVVVILAIERAEVAIAEHRDEIRV